MANIHNILIIDDDLVDLEALKKSCLKIIQQHQLQNIEPLCFSSSVKAINHIDNNSDIVLIICDIHIPDRDAVDIVNHMTQLGSPTPLLLITGGNTQNMLIAETIGVKNGVNVIGRAIKPVKDSDIESALRSLDLLPA